MVLYTYRLSTPHFIHYPILSITRLGFLIPTELHKCLRAPCNYRFLLPPLIVLVLVVVVPFLPLALLALPTYPKSLYFIKHLITVYIMKVPFSSLISLPKCYFTSYPSKVSSLF